MGFVKESFTTKRRREREREGEKRGEGEGEGDLAGCFILGGLVDLEMVEHKRSL